ncbi:MAG: DUF2752 domain-containing protein [Sandaracinaceae bacterium]
MPLAILAVIATLDVPVCPTRVVWGIPCPGCGLSRATWAALMLDGRALLHYHPLAPILTPLVLFAFAKPVLRKAGVWRGPLAALPRLPTWLWWALAAAMVGLWALRLFGFLGGHPDEVDFTQGLVWRAGEAILAGLEALRG